MKERAKYLEAAFNRVADGVLIVDGEMRIIEANLAAEAIRGTERKFSTRSTERTRGRAVSSGQYRLEGHGDCPSHGRPSHNLRIEGVEDVDVELVYDPPWTMERMSEEGRNLLGWG